MGFNFLTVLGPFWNLDRREVAHVVGNVAGFRDGLLVNHTTVGASAFVHLAHGSQLDVERLIGWFGGCVLCQVDHFVLLLFLVQFNNRV